MTASDSSKARLYVVLPPADQPLFFAIFFERRSWQNILSTREARKNRGAVLTVSRACKKDFLRALSRMSVTLEGKMYFSINNEFPWKEALDRMPERTRKELTEKLSPLLVL